MRISHVLYYAALMLIITTNPGFCGEQKLVQSGLEITVRPLVNEIPGYLNYEVLVVNTTDQDKSLSGLLLFLRIKEM